MTLETLPAWLWEYRYLAVFLLAIIEGPVIMTIAGLLLRLDFFHFWPLYGTLMAGDLTADALWYLVGYYGGRPFIRTYGKYASVTEPLIEKTEAAFHRHQNKVLFLSKITMGLGFALVILIAAGIARIPFRKYLAFNAFGQIFWTGALLAVGYYFGNFYLMVNRGLRVTAITAFILLVVAILYGASRYLKNRDVADIL
jgi:membrane protein DedA with SNARE-associated domain